MFTFGLRFLLARLKFKSMRSDIEIVNEIKEGKISAFRELYARYADLIYRNILARVNSSFVADDIFQDFLFKCGRKELLFKYLLL